MRVKNILIILFFVNLIFSGSIIKEFSFEKIDFKKIDNYDLINVEGCDVRLEEIGKPIIPFKNINILIPPSAEISSIEILKLERKELPGNYYLYPAQMPRPISEYEKDYPFIIDQEFYEREEEYPEEIYRIIPSGCKSGFRIGGIFLFPLHYIPKEKKLILYSKIRIKINYEEGKYDVIWLTRSQKELFSKDLKYLVINPEDIERFSPPIRLSDNPDIDYVILTDTNLVSAFIPLRNWLRKTGLWTEIRTTQWVNNNYSGRDLPEKIRNFIKNYFQTQGLKYVLLGGDADTNAAVVPMRYTGPLTVSGYTRYIACDLYYADCNEWSWDGDNDNNFGEWVIADTVDLYHDVYVGRLPVENASHISNFITKLSKYLKTPDTTYQKKLLLPGAYLFPGYNYMLSQESIANLSPSGWIDRLLDQGTNDARTYEVRDSINQKFHFVHLVAHGNYAASWINYQPQYHRNYTGQQTNTNALCIINAISCMPGAFDSAVSPSCLAESALNAPNSAIGVIMNTRFGWGTPPSVGPSERLDIRFYEHFFIRDSVRFSPCHQSSKERYRNHARDSAQVWRWCYFELTLFGEPSMLMWKDYPQKMVAYFPRTIGTGNQVFPCTVKALTGSPINQALVCLWKGNEVYQTGYTNTNGIVTFNINPTSAGYMYVTVTKPNYIPYEDSSQVILISYDVAVTQIIQPIGIVDSGATITPQAKVKNFGLYPASFQAIFRIGTFYNQSVSYNNLPPGGEVILNFPSWQALQRGSHIVKCTVVYTLDQMPNNNFLIDSVFVRVLDVAVLEIIAPTGIVDSGTNVIPRARIKNYGNVSSSFITRFRIGTFYNQEQNVNLGPNEEITVNFPLWQANQRGSHSVKCTVALSGDRLPNNNFQITNVFVVVKDVGVTQIVSPQGNIDSGTVIIPQAKVKNYGTQQENFKVRFSIGNFYLDSLTVTLNPDRETLLNFTPWTANQVGTHQVRCTTLLTGDMLPANNLQTGTVTVARKDVGVQQILAPVGTVDSGQVIIPQARVKNYGANPASFTVIFRIGTFYNNSQNITNLPPGESIVVSFSNWQALQRETHSLKCTVAFEGDQYPPNNFLTGSVFVRVRDVGVTEIISPTGTIDSGSVIIPQIKVKNFGNTTESFLVTFRIGTFYLNSQTVNNLGPGDSTVVNFSAWTALQRGTHTTKCTVALANDRNPDNNSLTGSIFVRVRDVGVTEIVSPSGIIDSGVVITPQAKVKNFGNTNESFKVKFSIGNFYLDSTNISLSFGRETLLTFTPWTANELGTHQIKCTTLLTGDMVTNNNYLISQVIVGFKDAGIIEIISPTSLIDSPGTIIPSVKVKNFGRVPVSFPIYFRISGPSSYFNSQNVLNLMPDEERQINFAFWQVGPRGNYFTTCSLDLIGDRNPNNDKIDSTFTVQVKDIGILAILSPRGVVDSGNSVIPQVRVRNYGSVNLLFKTILKIPPIYDDSQEISLPAGEETTLTFNQFICDTIGLFFVNCSLRISDANVLNNAKRETLFIAGVSERHVGVLRIVAPLYYGVSGEIRPLAVVKNFSPSYQSFKTFFKIVDSTNNNIVYFESTFVFNLAPNYSKDVAFPIWQAQVGLYSLTCSTYIPKDINELNDVKKGYVKIGTSLPEHWNLLRDLPLGPTSKKIKGGAALTFLRPNFIYAFKGNKTNEFYRYDITTGYWERKADIPYAQEKKKPVGNGGALTSDLERYVYAIKGNNTLEFWRYDVLNDRWDRLPDIPTGSKRVKDGAGLAYVKKGDSSFVYLLKGSKTNEFYAYYIEGNIWLNKTPAPLGPSNRPFAKGSAITFDNRENIYVLKGNYYEFYAYNINTGRWERKADLPMLYNNRIKKNKSGCALTANNEGIIFAFRGNNTPDFLAYYPEENKWYHKEPIPVYPSDKKVKDGGALTYSPYNNMIYAFKGNNTNEFWCYLFYETLTKREEIKIKESKQDEITNLINKKGILKYEIYDIQGRRVKEIKQKGLYLLKIYDNNSNLKTIKVIKVK
ncbi:MAG: C25 family cysteine peptidase [candidate division WOR-3 bacterium]|nr:C25 family cysteine peptidase [candidate division WOR-3 bacterium]